MRKVDNYIREFLTSKYDDGTAWKLIGQEIYSDEFNLKRLESSLRLLINDFHSDLSEHEPLENLASLGKEHSFSLLLQNLVPSIVEDIQEWTDFAYSRLIKNTRIVLAPLRTFSAFALNSDANRMPLDGYVIFVNQALYFCLRLLAKAALVENLQGDLAAFQQDGSPSYRAAIQLLFTADSKCLNQSYFEEMPPEIMGQVEAVQSQATIIVLIFVVLHELGHIVNNDFETLGIHRLQAVGVLDSDIDPSKSGIKTKVEREFKADQFAIDILCRKAKTDMELWANFSQIYLFFLWLADCENLYGQPFSDNHPSPLIRAEALLKYIQTLSSESEEISIYLSWLSDVTKRWSASLDIDKI